VRPAIFILFFAGIAAGLGSGLDLRRPSTAADRAKVIADGWIVSREALGSALIAAYQPGGPQRPGSTGVTAYRSWLSLWKWCDLLSRNQREEATRLVAQHLSTSSHDQKFIFFGPGDLPDYNLNPPDAPRLKQILFDQAAGRELLRRLLPADLADPPEKTISEELDPAILMEWINKEELSRLLFENLSEHDYSPGVLARLQEIRLANSAKFNEYRALAIALALVYDQKFPEFWPHRQVDPRVVPTTEISVSDRFRFWVESNESQALLLDLRKLGPGKIKFIVDAPLAPSEFQWARKHVKYQRSEFAKAFDAVSYSFGRASSGRYHWTSGEYSLENIYRHDGICIDQAYYAMIAGKARGLPTLFFTGQGTDGGHAWFGYLKSDDRWELDCGRFKNQNYAVGQALDPQTWRPISDHELEMHRRGLHDHLAFFSSQDDILIGRMSERAGDGAKALKAYESAIQVCPLNQAGWNAKTDYLQRSGAPSNVLRSHHENALRQFTTNHDLRAQQQRALAQIARGQGASQEAENLERQIVEQNKRKRSDLSVSLVAQKIVSLLAAKEFDLAFTEYRRQVATLGRFGGGNFFHSIVRPLAESLLAAGDAERAREVVVLARKTLKPENGSILDRELQELEKLAANGSSR
jgi:tetratricopeptide (TPR) repeat protein